MSMNTCEGTVTSVAIIKRNSNYFLRVDIHDKEEDKAIFLNECCDIPEWRDVRNSYKFTKIFCHRKLLFKTPQELAALVGQTMKCQAVEKPDGFFKAQNVVFLKPATAKKGTKGKK